MSRDKFDQSGLIRHLCGVHGLILLCCLVAIGGAARAAQMPAPVSDIRVLIDISGSMKQNDPANLRGPALKLLVGLLPDQSRSGVWMFGRYVNMQVKLGTVNAEWKQQARKAAEIIHSRGLYTNIEEAIRRASSGWTSADPAYRRNLILLTDGMVDVAKDASRDQASRNRILTELLPRLRKAGVHIHTVALSDNADDELLKTLSLSTGGWYEKILEADSLQRVFLRLFEQSAPTDALPLRQNRFSVDSSIKDMTLLVFQSDQQSPTRIIGPGDINWSLEKHPENVQWFHEQGYDMITVASPPEGDWSIDAPVDDDNRVMVVTNLRLNVSPLPAHILVGDGVTVASSLSEDGEIIKRDDFLKLIRFNASHTLADNSPVNVQLLDNGVEPDMTADNGVFTASMPRAMSSGEIELQINARSATFSRQLRHQIKVYESAIRFELKADSETHEYLLTVKQEPGLLDPESVRIDALLSGQKLVLEYHDQGKLWQVNIPAIDKEQQLDIQVRGLDFHNKLYQTRYQSAIAAQSPAVRSITSPDSQVPINEGLPDAETGDKPVTAVSESDAVQKKGDFRDELQDRAGETPVSEKQLQDEQEAQAGSKSGSAGRKWWLVTILVLCINLLLAGSGYFLWRYLKSKKVKFDQVIESGPEDSTEEAVQNIPVTENNKSEPTSDTEPESDEAAVENQTVVESEADREVEQQTADVLENQEPEVTALEHEPGSEPESEQETPPAPPGLPDAESLDRFLDEHKDMLDEHEVDTIDEQDMDNTDMDDKNNKNIRQADE